MKVFVIDDDQFSIFVTKNVIASEDPTNDIQSFLSGPEALKALNSGNDSFPDLIFLDLNMPLMDGWDFLHALAPLEPSISKRCSIYILTSSLDISDTIKTKDFPIVSGLIHKPIKREDIKLIASQFAVSDRSFSY